MMQQEVFCLVTTFTVTLFTDVEYMFNCLGGGEGRKKSIFFVFLTIAPAGKT